MSGAINGAIVTRILDLSEGQSAVNPFAGATGVQHSNVLLGLAIITLINLYVAYSTFKQRRREKIKAPVLQK